MLYLYHMTMFLTIKKIMEIFHFLILYILPIHIVEFSKKKRGNFYPDNIYINVPQSTSFQLKCV